MGARANVSVRVSMFLFFLLPPTYSQWQGIEPCVVMIPDMFGLVGNILPQVGQPTVISIGRNKA